MLKLGCECARSGGRVKESNEQQESGEEVDAVERAARVTISAKTAFSCPIVLHTARLSPTTLSISADLGARPIPQQRNRHCRCVRMP